MMEMHNPTIITGANVLQILRDVQVRMLPDGPWGGAGVNFCSPGTPATRTFSNAVTDAYVASVSAMSASDLGSSPTASQIVTVVRNYMTQYCRVRLHRVGDAASRHPYRSAFLRTNANHPSDWSILSAVSTAASSRGLVDGQDITAEKVNNFVNDCVGLWHSYCVNSPRYITAPAYCHGNHCNHSNHGSRGRR